MSDEMPDPYQLRSKLAQLHRQSESPTGQFGFRTTICQGRRTQSVAFESSWTKFFTKLLQHVIETNGPWNDLDQLEQHLISNVTPRLLNPLPSDGCSIKPSLIHGDL